MSRSDTPADSEPNPAVRSCWVVTDGKIGMESQCLALAAALGIEPEVKRIETRIPWRWLPPSLWRDPLRAIAGTTLAPPWPELLIASGRQAVAPALAVRRASKGRSFVVQIQNPTVALSRFDLVVAPRHDRLEGENLIETLGGLNAVTDTTLAAAMERFGAALAHLPHPRIAVVLGGPSKVHRMDESIAADLGQRLAALAKAEGGALLVTSSRRTGEANEAAVAKAIQGVPSVFWTGYGDNPYFAYLALADAIVVTADSVNMVSEAAATGKPIFVAELPGGSAKFERFHQALAEAGITRPFTGRLEQWRYPPLRETERVAAEITQRLRKRAMQGP